MAALVAAEAAMETEMSTLAELTVTVTSEGDTPFNEAATESLTTKGPVALRWWPAMASLVLRWLTASSLRVVMAPQ